ncbi:PIKK family atypical protein kinase [Trichomonas vaginalis G3]|uniref:Serine/threonine-protein kinase ATR n=1 Tax=Trichomonas vaginalis (strain ATCC PRA-98 / G3) TaxID=412133 RepID=A2DQ06_TRIV3|nr:ataxia telangiectasia mutated (ATM) -related family [Trichomonas vaginalis G3]EAY17433.1 PIKK family atypical protein kinase [Trichomonas vaginalis G3]KAI5533528.1 ataxia telangiectasia mutated (ATM) -related family [Trichomonas vaginalis G3]|eukprot:XP_001329568.1 PIKK family atypical protein kinase [Trichomonas vaginalis G3]
MDRGAGSEENENKMLLERLSVLVKYMFNQSFDISEIKEALSALDFSCMFFHHLLVTEMKLIQLCFNKLHRYGIEFNILEQYSRYPEILQKFIQVSCEFIAINKVSDRNKLIDEIMESIFFLIQNSKQKQLKFKAPSFGDEVKEINLKQEDIRNAINFEISILNGCLKRLVISSQKVIILASTILSSCDNNIRINCLDMLSNYCPLNITSSFVEIRAIEKFYFEIINNNLQESELEIFDNLLTKCYKNAISRIPNDIIILLGRETINVITEINENKFKIFNENLLNTVYKFIQSDQSSAQLIRQLIIKKLSVFYDSEEYINICKNFEENDTEFGQIIIKAYENQYNIIPALMKITNYIPNNDLIKKSSGTTFYKILSLLDSLESNLASKLNNYLETNPPTLENLRLISKHIPAQILEKYQAKDLPYIFSNNPQTLESLIQKWNLFSDVRIREIIPFMSLLLQKAKNISEFDFMKIKEYFNRLDDDYTLFFIPEFVDILDLVYDQSDLKKRYKNFIKNVKTAKIPQITSDGFMNSRILSPHFLLHLIKQLIISLENSQEKDIVYTESFAISCLQRNQTKLWSIYDLNKYKISYELYLLYKEEEKINSEPRTFRLLTKMIFNLQHRTNLSILEESVIPVLIQKQDLNDLKLFIKKSTSQNDEISFTNKINDNMADILCYLFSNFDKHEISNCLSYITKTILPGERAMHLMEMCFPDFACKMLSLLGDFDKKIVERTKYSIDVMIKSKLPKRALRDKEQIEHIFISNEIKMMYGFGKYITNGSSSRKITAIRSLTEIVKSMSDSLNVERCRNLLTMVSFLTTKDKSCRQYCYEFLNTILDLLHNNSILSEIFGFIVSQLIPNISQSPNETKPLLKRLIIDEYNVVQNSLYQISFVKEISEIPEISDKIKQSIESIPRLELIEKLIGVLNDATPALQVLIINQLIDLFEENLDFVKKNLTKKEDLCVMIWKILQNTNREDLQACCGRLLAVIYPSEEMMSNFHMNLRTQKNQNTNVNVVMKNIITDYLIPAYEDVTMFSVLDSISCAIQNLLNELGCSLQNQSQRNMRSPENWDMFDKKTQMIIDKYRSSRYLSKDVSTIKTPIFSQNIKHEQWLTNFTIMSLQIDFEEIIPDQTDIKKSTRRTKDSDYEDEYKEKSKRKNSLESLRKISFIFKRIPSICNYILPLICYWQKYNPKFQELFSQEFLLILENLKQKTDKNSNKSDDTAIQCMHTIFTVFDNCSNLRIFPNCETIPNHVYSLNLASHQQLYEAAFLSGLFTHSLIHLEEAIREENIKPLSDDRKQNMLKVYKHLNEPDGLNALRLMSRNVTFSDDNQLFSEAKIINKMNTNSERIPKMTISYLTNLLKCGRYERALNDSLMYRNTMRMGRRLDAVIARAATRLSKWEVVSLLSNDTSPHKMTKDDDMTDIVDIGIANALSTLDKRQFDRFENIIEKMRIELANPLQQDSNLSFERMMPNLINYLLIEELSLFGKSLFQNSVDLEKTMKLFNSIDERLISIDDIERITVVNCAMLEIYYKNDFYSSPKSDKNTLLMEQWVKFASACRKSGELQRSQFACWRAFQLENNSISTIETAKITWSLHDKTRAVSLLNPDLRQNKIFNSDEEIGKFTYLRAKWNQELDHLLPDELMKQYQDASKLMKKNGKCYYQMANLADERLESYLEYFEKIHYGTSMRRNAVSKFVGTNSNPGSILEFLQKNTVLALECYMKCLSNSPELAPEVVPRVLQIYFDQGKFYTLTEKDNLQDLPYALSKISPSKFDIILSGMTEVFQKCLDNVNNSVWLNSITQLISRVEQPTKLEDKLYNLIRKSLYDFPEQTFWHLMSVKHSLIESRKKCYNAIFEQIDKNFPNDDGKIDKIHSLSRKFETITDLLEQLASKSMGSSRAKTGEAKSLCPDLYNAFNNSNILMPLSSTLTVKSSQNNLSFEPKISQMQQEIVIFSSLQRPKKISLLGSDGNNYHYLCKNDDDLRKDMRMMEFATFINRTFSNDRRCRDRNLSIVTFAVICLNEKCGIIEWAENTCSFKSILDKYMKQGKIGLSRSQLLELCCDKEQQKEISEATKNKKRQNFVNKILPFYPPQLHKWFMHRFCQPQRWFQSRLHYARSTAVWSMVGYIVGLGDRHTENILLNENTGGAVHVDFCCMFDKAKTLPVPECVPFRLTQNVVDGFGVLGTDGPFTESSVCCLTAMRDKKQKLVSVLQTFIHDPLLEWKQKAMSDKSREFKQNKDSNEAKMVLYEVDCRLSGLTEDKSRPQSPECVVKNLITQATDNDNLALMYIGWTPYI